MHGSQLDFCPKMCFDVMILQSLLHCEVSIARAGARGGWWPSSEANKWLHVSLQHTLEVQVLLSSCSVKGVDTCLGSIGMTHRHAGTAADGGWKAQRCAVWRGSISQYWKIGAEDVSDLRASSSAVYFGMDKCRCLDCAVPVTVLQDVRIIWRVFKGRKWPRQSCSFDWRIWEETLL